MAARAKPYTLEWPLNAYQLANIDEMFDTLFRDATVTASANTSDFVPYTGANAHVNLGAFNLGFNESTPDFSVHVNGTLGVGPAVEDIWTAGPIIGHVDATGYEGIVGIANADQTANNGAYVGVLTKDGDDTVTFSGTMGFVTTDHAAGAVDGDFLVQCAVNSTLTDRLRVSSAGNVTATLFTGSGAGLTSVSLTTGVTGDLPFSNLAQIAALSVLGVTGNSTADVAAITAGTDHQVLRRSGTALTFGAVALSQSAAVTGRLPAANLYTEVTFTTTGNIDNLDFSNADLIRMNNATLATIRGLVAGTAGQRVTIITLNGGNVELAHQNANSSEANRLINFATSANTPLAANVGAATYEYDATTARWRLICHEQGAPITPTFAAGDYTASGAMTWTVGSGDVASQTYYLSGRVCRVKFALDTTSTGGVADTALQVGNGAWGGFTGGPQSVAPMAFVLDAAVVDTGALAQVNAGGSIIRILKTGFAVWSAVAVNNTSAYADVLVDVQ